MGGVLREDERRWLRERRLQRQNAGSSDGWGARRGRTSCRYDREQVLLMPSWFAEWLPGDHLAWFVLAAVDEMDLAAFYAADRRDGHGRAAHAPSMMA